MTSGSSSSAPVIEAQGVTKIFRDFWGRPKVRAVDRLSLVVRQGDVYGLLGPNGSGKSTTIKILLDLLHPTSGTVKVLGRSPRDAAAREQIGYLPEESLLYPYLTAAETLEFYGQLFRMSGRERRARVCP